MLPQSTLTIVAPIQPAEAAILALQDMLAEIGRDPAANLLVPLGDLPPSASKVDASPKRPFQPGGLMEFFQCVRTARRSKRMSVVG